MFERSNGRTFVCSNVRTLERSIILSFSIVVSRKFYRRRRRRASARHPSRRLLPRPRLVSRSIDRSRARLVVDVLVASSTAVDASSHGSVERIGSDRIGRRFIHSIHSMHSKRRADPRLASSTTSHVSYGQQKDATTLVASRWWPYVPLHVYISLHSARFRFRFSFSDVAHRRTRAPRQTGTNTPAAHD